MREEAELRAALCCVGSVVGALALRCGVKRQRSKRIKICFVVLCALK